MVGQNDFHASHHHQRWLFESLAICLNKHRLCIRTLREFCLDARIFKVMLKSLLCQYWLQLLFSIVKFPQVMFVCHICFLGLSYVEDLLQNLQKTIPSFPALQVFIEVTLSCYFQVLFYSIFIYSS